MRILQNIVVNTGISASGVRRIINTAPLRYKRYEIPKKSGGVREIAQPSSELKIIQRYLLREVLNDLPVHPAAMAYVTEKNIGENANAHRDNSAILKLDFQAFFPSIKPSDWVEYVKKYRPEWNEYNTLRIMIHILFWGRGSSTPTCLSIGAPTSPLISNVLMYDFDEEIFQEARRRRLTYTRYADDITISGMSLQNILDFELFIQSAIKAQRHPKLKLNKLKRGVYTKGQRRLVTGLVLTPERKVSIGRARKRTISSLVHKFVLGDLNIDEIGYAKGLLGFAKANEPEFVDRLKRKYGHNKVEELMKTQLPRDERFLAGK